MEFVESKIRGKEIEKYTVQKMATSVFDRVRQLYDFQMWSSLAEFSGLFAGVMSAAAAASTTPDIPTSSSSTATVAVSLAAKQKVALQVMVAHALIEGKEFARAEALLRDALQHREGSSRTFQMIANAIAT